MMFFSFYLIGVLIVFYIQVHLLPYKDAVCFGISKTEYTIKTLTVSLASWLVFILLIFMFLEGKRE